jgi:hypothetical protein
MNPAISQTYWHSGRARLVLHSIGLRSSRMSLRCPRLVCLISDNEIC